MSEVKTVDISEDGNWLRDLRNKHSFSDILNKYKKITNNENPDVLEVLDCYKSFHVQPNITAEKIWTKPEWEAYKKEHPATEIKPKFKIKEKTQKEDESNNTSPSSAPQPMDKSLGILKERLNLNNNSFIENIENFKKSKNSSQELASTLKSQNLDIDVDKLSKHIVKAINSFKPSEETTPKDLIAHILTQNDTKGSSLLDLKSFKDGASFINNLVSGLVQKGIFTDNDKYEPIQDSPNNKYNITTSVDNELNNLDHSDTREYSDRLQNNLLDLFKKNKGIEIPKIIQTSQSAISIRKAVENKFNKLNKNPQTTENFEKNITEFTGEGYMKHIFSGMLSKKVQQVYDLDNEGPDWRMETAYKKAQVNNLPKMKAALDSVKLTNEAKEGIKFYIKKEQEILKQSGLVDNDGYLTLYRCSKHVNGKKGENVNTKGNYIDSWCFQPNFEGTVLRAKVHISQVVSSCVGNEKYPITEGEVILMGKNVTANIRGKMHDTFDAMDLEKSYRKESIGKLEKRLPKENEEINKSFTKGINKDNKEPSPRDLMLFKKSLGDKGKDMDNEKLLVLFKTLAAKGQLS